MISFVCAFVAFLLFSEHIRVAASNYHSNLSIILGIFRKKINALNINLFPMGKTLDNLRQFVNTIRRNTMIAALDEI